MQPVLLYGTQQFSSWPEARHKAYANTLSELAASLCMKNTQGTDTLQRQHFVQKPLFVIRYFRMGHFTKEIVFLDSHHVISTTAVCLISAVSPSSCTPESLKDGHKIKNS